MNDLRLQKEIILKKLKEQGCRITKQRMELIHIILENECSNCKEIYYKAAKTDKKIGIATVCIWHISTAGFAEQNGRNAKLNGRITFDY